MIIQQQIIYQVKLTFQINAFKDPEDIGLAITETNLHIWHFHKPNWACINVWLFFFFLKTKARPVLERTKLRRRSRKELTVFLTLQNNQLEVCLTFTIKATDAHNVWNWNWSVDLLPSCPSFWHHLISWKVVPLVQRSLLGVMQPGSSKPRCVTGTQVVNQEM